MGEKGCLLSSSAVRVRSKVSEHVLPSKRSVVLVGRGKLFLISIQKRLVAHLLVQFFMPQSVPPLPPSKGLIRGTMLSESFQDLCAVAPRPAQPISKLSLAIQSTSEKRSTAADLLKSDKFVPVVRK